MVELAQKHETALTQEKAAKNILIVDDEESIRTTLSAIAATSSCPFNCCASFSR